MPGGRAKHAGDGQRLVTRARNGDRVAASEFCSRWQRALVRFCTRYLHDRDAAEDAAQDVLAKVVVDGRWPEGAPRAWLFRLARNRCLDQIRCERTGARSSATVAADSYPSSHTDPRAEASRREQNERLREVVESLPPLHSEVLALRYFEELSRRDIARQLAITEQLVRSRLCEARRVLTRRIGHRSWTLDSRRRER